MGKLTKEILQGLNEFEQLKSIEELESKKLELLALNNEAISKIEEFQEKVNNTKTDNEIIELKKEFELLIDMDEIQEIREKMHRLTLFN